MKENVGLVVLEHLSHKFHVHVLDVDFLWLSLMRAAEPLKKMTHLEAFVQEHNGFIELFLSGSQWLFRPGFESSYHVCYDA
jgi:hypothetical protein